MTLAEVAADFDVSLESVRRWKRQAEIDDGVTEGRTTAEQSEVLQLRRDKRRLEMENEILRRAAAYFALPLRDQGRVLEPDRGLLDRRPHDRPPCHLGAALRDRQTPTSRHRRGPQRPPIESAQFRSRTFRATLKATKLTGSVGRVGAAGDNAAMESFFALVQKYVLNRRRHWATRAQLRNELVYWIEHTYNRRHRQRALGKLTPVEFELAFTPQPTEAHAA